MADNRIWGYIRVSSKGQNDERQRVTMAKLGITDENRNLFVDKQSGKDFNREDYQLLKRIVQKGDTVVFDSITRMGRNMKDTINEYEWFIENEINLKFIKEPMIDTIPNMDDKMQQLFQRIILTLLTAFAEMERDDIRERQAEGIANAKAKGITLGRPKSKAIITDAFIDAYTRWKNGEITGVQAMKDAKLTRATFYRLVAQYEESNR